MSKVKELEDLTKAIVECIELDQTKNIVRRALKAGAKPLQIVNAVSKGLDRVGDLYDKKVYFLMELVLAGSTASEVMAMIQPEFERETISIRGKTVIGTVLGDFHFIGKDIVITMLHSVGFEVIDLGVDVAAETFLSAVRENQPDVLAMSGLLTTVVEEMKKVIDGLKREGLRDSVKVMIGGRAVSQKFADEIGADAFGATAIDAVRLAKDWIGSN